MIKRRQKGEPMAYILGYKDFMGLRFKVNKDVLIPRPETEELVEQVIKSVKLLGYPVKKNSPSPLFGQRGGKGDVIKILDVGTGSGCIAAAIAKQLQQVQISNIKYQIYASDISPKALAVAKHNAKTHQVKIKFIHSDLLSQIRMKLDVIVANLPYLPSEALAKEGGSNTWKNNTSTETVGLKFEPQQALFTKEYGLYYIRSLLEQIADQKQQPKIIFLEFDPRQKAELHRMIKRILPDTRTEFFKDLFGRWRFCQISRREFVN
jgi:release factor glutamine methyltransferase